MTKHRPSVNRVNNVYSDLLDGASSRSALFQACLPAPFIETSQGHIRDQSPVAAMQHSGNPSYSSFTPMKCIEVGRFASTV